MQYGLLDGYVFFAFFYGNKKTKRLAELSNYLFRQPFRYECIYGIIVCLCSVAFLMELRY